MGIEIKNLVMEYKKGIKSLNHINLTIEHGIYGLLGENGAGKTTLMKILVTLLTPTKGEVKINGLKLEKENWLSAAGTGIISEYDCSGIFGICRNYVRNGEKDLYQTD